MNLNSLVERQIAFTAFKNGRDPIPELNDLLSGAHCAEEQAFILSQIATYYGFCGRLDEANDFFRRAVDANPADISMRLQWAYFLSSVAPEQAFDQYLWLVQRVEATIHEKLSNELFRTIHHGLIIVALKLKRHDQIEKSLRRLVQFDFDLNSLKLFEDPSFIDSIPENAIDQLLIDEYKNKMQNIKSENKINSP